jgi:hypothetical protein
MNHLADSVSKVPRLDGVLPTTITDVSSFFATKEAAYSVLPSMNAPRLVADPE